MKNTAQFNKIDEVSDAKEASRLKLEQKHREAYDRTLSCEYLQGGGLYVRDCTNPERSKDNGNYRRCIDVDCPLFA
jgi:hypothetical protein